MKRVLVVLLLSLVACGGEPAVDTSTSIVRSLTAIEVTEQLYAALGSGDFDATAAIVDEEGLVVLTAIESNSSDALLVADERRSQIRNNFWAAFVATATEFQSSGGVLLFRETDEVVIDGDVFQVVSVRDELGASEATWVLRQTSSGWLVDPIATFGSSFAGPIEIWLAALSADDQAEALPIVAGQLPSWRGLSELLDDTESGVAVGEILGRLIPRLESVTSSAP